MDSVSPASNADVAQRLLEAITAAQQRFFQHAAPQEVFGSLLNVLLELTESEYGFVGPILRKEGQPYLKTHAITNSAWTEELRSWYDEHAPNGLELYDLETLFGAVITSGELLIANDPGSHAQAGGTPAGHPPLRAFLGVPLYQSDELVGMVGIANRPGGYEAGLVEEMRPLLGTMAQLILAYRESARRELLEGKLRLNEERWHYALNGSDDGVWDWNVQTGRVFYSERYSTMLGYEPGELAAEVGTWRTLVHPDDLPAAMERVEAHIAGETDRYVAEFRALRKDGSYAWVRARGQLISRTPEGAPRRFVGTHTDITAEVEAAAELLRAKEAAESATRVKAEFLATMSHEIRTPMNGVLGMTALLLGTEVSSEQRNYLEMLQRSGDHLLTLIDDVLDFSRVDAGRLQLEALSYDLHGLLDDTFSALAPLAEAQGLEFVFERDSRVPGRVLGDPHRLRQVLTNLLGNAIKFTEAGRVSLLVGVDEARTTFEVVDTGIGVAPEAQARLFEPFFQADGSTSRTYGGTGLGLAISARLVELQGGTLSVESELGAGARFRFALPLPVVEGPEGVGALDDVQEVPPAHVLLVEDNTVNRMVAQALLARLSLTVDTASNGLEALAAFEKNSYDLILMDVQMPGMDGIEATEHIRRREGELGCARTPILAVTANAFADNRERCRAVGMDDFLAKPFRLDDLTQRLASLLGATWTRQPPDLGNGSTSTP